MRLCIAQMHNDRMDAYFDDVNKNAQLFGGTGRDKGLDRSFKSI